MNALKYSLRTAVLVAVLAAAAADDETDGPSIEDQAGMFLLLGRYELMDAMSGLIVLSQRQMAVRGVTADQRECLAAYVRNMQHQLYKLRTKSVGMSHTAFERLRLDSPAEARKLAEEIVDLRDKTGEAVNKETEKQVECLFGG